MTLSQKDLRTLTLVAASPDFTGDNLLINGEEHPLLLARTQACLGLLRQLRREKEDKETLEKISSYGLRIVSENNFPTAAGLALSAAGFAALVTAIAKLYQLDDDMSELLKIARQGLGLACRSLFGGFVAWEMGTAEDGSDLKAVQIADVDHWPGMKAAILVVSDLKKDTPSTTGMQTTVATSELFVERIRDQVPRRFAEMKQLILDKDFDQFAKLTMQDSNSFHAVCLDSYPPIFYLNDTLKQIIRLVHQLNEEKIVAAYTFDAGPNAVIYYPEEHELKVLGLLHQHFGKLPGWEGVDASKLEKSNIDAPSDIADGVSRLILTEIGPGPQVLETSLVDEHGNQV